MDWNQQRASWQTSNQTSQAEDLVIKVRSKQSDIYKRIVWRDRLEILVAAILGPVFIGIGLFKLLTGGFWPGIFAAFLGIWCFVVIARLRWARRHEQVPGFNQDLHAFLSAELQAMRRQRDMLKSILWWYLGPLGIGVIGLYTSISGVSVKSAVYAGVVIVVYAFIYFANQAAAKNSMQTRIDEIKRALNELDKEFKA